MRKKHHRKELVSWQRKQAKVPMSQFNPKSGLDDELQDLRQVQKILQEVKSLIQTADSKQPIPSSRIGSLSSRLRLHLSRLSNATVPQQRTRTVNATTPVPTSTSSRPRAEQLRARVDTQAMIFQKSLQEKAQYSKLASLQSSQCPLTIASIEQRAQLLPVQEFLDQYPEYASDSIDTHELILQRLHHERQLRQNLIDREQQMRQYKEQLEVRIEKRKASLFSIEQVVNNFVHTTQNARRQVESAIQQCWQQEPPSTTAAPTAKRQKTHEESTESVPRKFQIPEKKPDYIPVNIHMSPPPARLHELSEPLQLLACGLLSCTNIFHLNLLVERTNCRTTTWGDISVNCHELMLCVDVTPFRLYFNYCQELHTVFLSVGVLASQHVKSSNNGDTSMGDEQSTTETAETDASSEKEYELLPYQEISQLSFIFPIPRFPSADFYPFACNLMGQAMPNIPNTENPNPADTTTTQDSSESSSGISPMDNSQSDIPECPLGIAPAWLQRLCGLNNSGAHIYSVSGHVYDPFYEKSFAISVVVDKNDNATSSSSATSDQPDAALEASSVASSGNVIMSRLSGLFAKMDGTLVSVSWTDALRRLFIVLLATIKLKRNELEKEKDVAFGNVWENEKSGFKSFFPTVEDLSEGINAMYKTLLIQPSSILTNALQSILSSVILPTFEASSSSTIQITNMSVVNMQMKPQSTVNITDLAAVPLKKHHYEIAYSAIDLSTSQNITIDVLFPPAYPLSPPMFTLHSTDDATSRTLLTSGLANALNTLFTTQMSAQVRVLLISGGFLSPIDYALAYLRLKFDGSSASSNSC